MRAASVGILVLALFLLGACDGDGGGGASGGDGGALADAAASDVGPGGSDSTVLSDSGADVGDSVVDAASDGSPSDAAADGGADVAGVDAAEVAPDGGGPADTGTTLDVLDATVDGGAGPDGADAGCAPVDCALWCEHGFAAGPDGCPVCACRDCATPADCGGGCPAPTCSDAGACGCDCAGSPAASVACPDGSSVPWCACSGDQWSCEQDPLAACAGLVCGPGGATTWACPGGGAVPLCGCQVPGESCAPVCGNPGTADEGWLDGCTGALLKKTKCASCDVECGAIGSKSEGWYSTCDGLIGWDLCATGQWSCDLEPWATCQQPPTGLGAPCASDDECSAGVLCAGLQAGPAGVCTQVCNPASAAALACGPGLVCVPVTDYQAPGLCLSPCETGADCQGAMTCGVAPGGDPQAGACFPWIPCDARANTGCTGAEQCRVTGGQASCGAPGTAGEGASCSAVKPCGPGLVCGSVSQCWPACTDDSQCTLPKYDFCLKKVADAPWGHCMHLE